LVIYLNIKFVDRSCDYDFFSTVMYIKTSYLYM